MQPKKNKTFNILHVVSRLPIGGVETLILNEISRYDKKRFNASVCCLQEGGEIADELESAGFKVHILNKMKGHGFDLGAVIALCKFIKSNNIHILRTHQYHANLYGRMAGILAGVPVKIPSFHNVYAFPKKPKFSRSIFNYILSFFSDKLVACSNTVALDMIRYDKVSSEKIKVIHNGIDLKEFKSKLTMQEARKLLNLPDDLILIGSVGRLDEQKGHHYLVRAVSEIRDSCVVIAGDGPLMEDLRNLAKKNISKAILMGMMKPEKIPIFMKALDIFCFPSLWEGFGIAVAEAMATGLPVIASDIMPLREVVDEAGILVSPGDAAELTKALKLLIDTPALRNTLGSKAAERAELFSIEKSVKSFESLFEERLFQKGLL